MCTDINQNVIMSLREAMTIKAPCSLLIIPLKPGIHDTTRFRYYNKRITQSSAERALIELVRLIFKPLGYTLQGGGV